MWKFKALLLAVALFSVACTKHPGAETPEAAVREYVNIGFHAKNKADRQRLLQLSTGEAYEELAGISDEDFEKRFVQSKLRLVNLQTRDLRRENNGDVSLIYEISYEEPGASSPSLLTNKKIAFLTQDEKTKLWKIKSTTNVKSLIERKEDLPVTPQSSPGQH